MTRSERSPATAGTLHCAMVAAAIALGPGCYESADEIVAPVDITTRDAPRPAAPVQAEELRVRVIAKYPHDSDAFTQGLIWHEGVMYESAGRYGKSSLRKVRLEDGRVLSQRKINPNLFAEGLTRVGDRLIQLTWHAGRALVSDLETLRERGELSYRGEGWGLCYDGTALVMSDGSSILKFRDPRSMEVIREVSVLKNGHPVSLLNELECVGSEIYANVWRRNEILRIDARTGSVTASIDASGLLSRIESIRADVLNGIAYKPDSKTFLITGKLWPHLFEVELLPR